MPYIEPKQREELDPAIDALVAAVRYGNGSEYYVDHFDGRLNYAITRLIGGVVPPKTAAWRYNLIARVMGCLECVKAEFYRRLAGPYEDIAIAKNGDLAEYL